jgi:hypothetical protein
MDLRPYIDEIHRQLEATAEAGGDDTRVLVQRLSASLDAAVRLSLLDALTAAAQEITCDLAPTSVEVRLRGRDPEFVVTTPTEPADTDPLAGTGSNPEAGANGIDSADGGSADDAEMVRINLRMPDRLKVRVDQAAARQGLSVNAWLVRVATTAVDRAEPERRFERRGPQGPQRFTGWAR